jgi:hypothetical protein
VTSTERIARRYAALYRRAGGMEGSAWYFDAHRTARRLARRYKVTLGQAAGVIAAMSPGMSWKGNVTVAGTIIGAFVRGAAGPPKAGLTRNVANAWGVLQGHPVRAMLRGPKTYAFYRSIMGHQESAVIDRWMMRAAGFDKDSPTAREYGMLSKALRLAAKREGVKPNVLQAVVWTYARGSAT